MDGKAFLTMVSSAAFALALNATTYTSASYIQNGLIAQWDGIDNAGTGTHDPNATTWKDLKGDLDMTLTAKGSWNGGNALYVAGGGAGAQGADKTPAYKTVEIVFKMTTIDGRIIFSSGIGNRFVVVDTNSSDNKFDGKYLYFNGDLSTGDSDKRIYWFLDKNEVCFAAATYGDSKLSNVYFNGEVRNDGTMRNNWGVGDGKVAVGGRSIAVAGTSYPWTGEVYAIRLYNRVLTAEEIASNSAIDKARFLPPEDEAEALTSSSYVQDGLVGQYDGIDNQGTGTHDSTATTWKDLAGSNDLTLTNTAAWCRGIGLSMNQQTSGSAGAYGKTVAPAYKTIEILFKETARNSRILLWSGDNSRYVLFDYGNVTYPFVWAYFDGRKDIVKARPTPYVKMQAYVPTALAATYGTNNEVDDVFCDGVERQCGGSVNDWAAGVNRLTLGARTLETSNYGWSGEIYAIRFYNRVLTPEEIARNHAIDVKRFYTSAIYDKTGMTSFWDARDNVGEGRHDSTTNIWKNLVAGEQDLTLRNSRWKSTALQCYNVNASGAYGTTSQTFSSMEVVFRNELNYGNSWLFSGGVAGYYCVLGTWRAQWCNFEGLYDTFDYSRCGLHSLATVRGLVDSSGVVYTNAYVDGVNTYYDWRRSPARSNDLDNWGYGGAFVQVGGRSDGSVDFLGRIHSVRLYSGKPSSDRVWSNSEIDRVRYENSLTWHGPANEIGDGDFEASGNWVDLDQSFQIPGEDHTDNLPYGTYTIRMLGNRTVAAMSARNGNVEKVERYIDATLDMGGKTFTVLGAYKADSARGVLGHRNAKLTLTNGTFNAESFEIGALAERTSSQNAVNDYANAFKRGSGSLIMEGANTSANITRLLRAEGPFTHIRVAGGAQLSCGGLRDYAEQAGEDRAQFEITGSGTTATIGKSGLCTYRDVDITVSDGAALSISGHFEYFSPLGGSVNILGRCYLSTPGDGSRFVVDDATVTLEGYPFVVGANLYSGKFATGSSFTLQNNAKLVMKGSGMSRFVVGAGANESNPFAEKNVLNVLDGSVFGYGSGGASARLEIGICGNTSFSGVNVSNATVNCVRLIAGSMVSPAASSNNFVNVMGETAKVNVSGNGSDSIYLRMGTRLKFTIPENGFAATPVETAGGVKVENDEDFFAVDPVKLVLDGSEFVGGKQTLISCVSNSTYFLQRLVSNKEGRGMLKIEDDGTKLVYYKSGVILIVR